MLTLLFASALALSSPTPLASTPHTQTQTTPMLCVAGYDVDCPDAAARVFFDVPSGAIGYRGTATGVTDNEPQREECATVEMDGLVVCAGQTITWTEGLSESRPMPILVHHLSADQFDPIECAWNPDKPWLYRLGNACTPGSMHVTVRVEFAFPPAPTTIATTTTVKPTDVATVKVEQDSPTTLAPPTALAPSIADPTIVEPETLPATGTSATRLVPWALLLIALGAVLHVRSQRKVA